MIIQITKRDGSKQPLDLDKFHKVVAFACEGITGVSASEIELKSQIQFQNNMTSAEIQETLIKAAANLINEETPNYQFVAGRLVNYHIRKEVYGDYKPVPLFDHVTKLVKLGLYDKNLLKLFTKEEYDQLDKIVDHQRDEALTYAAMEQFRGKYLVKNRVTGQIYETPQMAYILIAATLFASYPKDTRMKWIKDYYDAISQHYISLATPLIAGIRTTERQYSSCTMIESGDSLDSIIATTGAVTKYISARAGIGIHGGHIAAEGDSVKNGARSHTGITPFWRMMQSAVRSCSQGGVRGGAATMNWPFFHLEFKNLIVLKNNKGTEDNRLRFMDYCILATNLFYQRYLDNEDITLFSPREVPELVEAFYADQELFEELYRKAERNNYIRKAKIPAREMWEMIAEERFNTGRIYLMNVDHANNHGPYIPARAPIKTTNLCVEITNTTKPLTSNKEEGEIALCTLSALNVGTIKTVAEMLHYANLAVRALNLLIDYQDYPVYEAERATKHRRPIGVGIINLAYWLAKNDSTYSKANFDLLDELFETFSYAVIKASADLALEMGPCPGFADTKWSQGILPIDTYKKDVDDLLTRRKGIFTHNWQALREQIMATGIVNSTLLAGMPSETSSQAANGTSGFDPIQAIVMYKQSKDGVLAQVVPEPRRLKNRYEKLWEMPNTRGVLEVNAIATKYFDQSISTNTSYNPANYPNGEVPLDEIIYDIFYAYKLGLKTLYYNNTLDGATDDHVDLPQENEMEESCESCVL